MVKRNFLTTYGVYFITVVLVLFIMYPLQLFGQAGNPEHTNKIETKDNLVSVVLQDADLSEVLKEIEKGTGIKITIAKELVGQKITAQFENLDVESALKNILIGQYYVLIFSQDPTAKEKKTLKEVKAGGPAIGSKTLKGGMITIDIPYGSGKGEVGADIGDEGASRGPKSFAVDDEGEIYISDTVNGRIQVFSHAGSFLFTVPLRGHLPTEEGNKRIYSGSLDDIVVDKSELIYIYDRMARKLYQYDKKGNIITAINVDTSQWGGSGSMHIVNNVIYVYDCDSKACGDIIIGRILGNRLVGPSVGDPKRYSEAGKTGRSGKKYMTSLKRFGKGELEIEEKQRQTEMLSFPLKGILSIKFLGEDKKGNFYIKTEKDENEGVVVDVHKFNANCEYMCTFNMPDSNVFFIPIREYIITESGDIYLFLPEKDILRLNIFPSSNC